MLKMQSSARRKAYITAMKLLMGVAAVLTCALVVGMIGYILGNGIPNITWEMLSTAPSYLANRVGILPDILSTLYIVIATLLIVLPLGVGALLMAGIGATVVMVRRRKSAHDDTDAALMPRHAA